MKNIGEKRRILAKNEHGRITNCRAVRLAKTYFLSTPLIHTCTLIFLLANIFCCQLYYLSPKLAWKMKQFKRPLKLLWTWCENVGENQITVLETQQGERVHWRDLVRLNNLWCWGVFSGLRRGYFASLNTCINQAISHCPLGCPLNRISEEDSLSEHSLDILQFCITSPSVLALPSSKILEMIRNAYI